MKIFCAVVFEALHINFQTIIGNRDIAWQFGLHSFVQTKLMTHVYKICVFGIDFLYQLKRLLNSKMRIMLLFTQRIYDKHFGATQFFSLCGYYFFCISDK